MEKVGSTKSPLKALPLKRNSFLIIMFSFLKIKIKVVRDLSSTVEAKPLVLKINVLCIKYVQYTAAVKDIVLLRNTLHIKA